jgi:hypothetical protein
MKSYNSVIMGSKKSILSFCLTSEMCKLINKVIKKFDFVYQGILVSEAMTGKVEDEILNKISFNPDIIILDKDVEKDLKEKIVKKFSGSSIICLPSLSENNEVSTEKVKQISEPFKLREFEEVILKLSNKKTDTDVN